MDFDIFKSEEVTYRIHTLNMDEWRKFRGNWNDYIRFLDLGIICINRFTGKYRTCKYKITDEKKWVLAKIKYGF